MVLDTLLCLYFVNSYGVNGVKDRYETLTRIRAIADYQLGRGAGKALFPNRVKVVFSRRTGRIRHIYLDEELLATLRPRDGMFSLTLAGAKRLLKGVDPLRLWVKVPNDVACFVADGKSVFAKHVVGSDPEIRPQEEVIVVDEDGSLVAVGRAVLTGREMLAFKRGVAVKVRRGVGSASP